MVTVNRDEIPGSDVACESLDVREDRGPCPGGGRCGPIPGHYSEPRSRANALALIALLLLADNKR